MNRRRFLQTTAGALALGALKLPAATPAGAGGGGAADALLAELIRANDALVPGLLARQLPTGAVVDRTGIANPHDCTALIATLVSVRHAAGSRYHRDPALLDPLERAAAALVAAQHEDGTIDLIATNFHSPPDTAFIIESIAPVAAVLRRANDPAEARVRERLETFLRRASKGLISGGVHTPNHRWVVCGALAHLHHLFGDSRCLARIDQWLAEGIDLDPDGQYTEKSTSVYSPVVDRALLTVARLVNRPELREPVRRNLEMTLYYVHPDGEVVTEASKRQDKYQRGSMGRYYYSYRTLARIDGNGRFAAMARQIERTATDQLTRELLTYLEEPEFATALPPDAPLPTDYARVFAYSQLARIRRGAVSGTVLAQNSTLFSYRKGQAALEAVRFASAFFGKGQFVGDELGVLEGGGYRLEQKLEGPYFQPLSPAQIASGEHVRMAPNGTLAVDSRAARAQSNVQRLTSRVQVTEDRGRFRLEIELAGTDGVPVAVELAFRHGGRLDGVERVADVPDSFLLSGGTGRYTVGNDTITFGPGQAAHRWTQLRGALPKWDGQSVYLTGLTPFRLNLEIA